jgi:hypothetical protein
VVSVAVALAAAEDGAATAITAATAVVISATVGAGTSARIIDRWRDHHARRE